MLDRRGALPLSGPMQAEHLPDSILIVDFGSQVTQLIARRVREAGVYSEIAPFTQAEEAFHRLQPKGIILSGSPASVCDEGSPRAPQVLFDSGLPILGICYGQQVMTEQLGGEVRPGHETGEGGEFGRAYLTVSEQCALFDGLWQTGDRRLWFGPIDDPFIIESSVWFGTYLAVDMVLVLLHGLLDKSTVIHHTIFAILCGVMFVPCAAPLLGAVLL